MKISPLFYSLVMFLVIAFALPVHAQSEPTATGETPGEVVITAPETQMTDEETESAILNRIYQQLPLEDQERLIEETYQVEAYCNQKGLFSHLHDCQCVAAEFFEERIRQPELHLNIISLADNVADRCPNIPGVAGYAYNDCTSNFRNIIKSRLDDFCTCYANVYANVYKTDARSFFPRMGKVMSIAILECDAKGLPSPTNPLR